MGQHIHYKNGKFAIWSTVVDAYLTYGMSEVELAEYVKEEEGERGLAILSDRIRWAKERGNGCSASSCHEIPDFLWYDGMTETEYRTGLLNAVFQLGIGLMEEDGFPKTLDQQEAELKAKLAVLTPDELAERMLPRGVKEGWRVVQCGWKYRIPLESNLQKYQGTAVLGEKLPSTERGEFDELPIERMIVDRPIQMNHNDSKNVLVE